MTKMRGFLFLPALAAATAAVACLPATATAGDGIREAYALVMNGALHAEMLANFDANGDGKLSADERGAMRAAFAAQSFRPRREGFRRGFHGHGAWRGPRFGPRHGRMAGKFGPGHGFPPPPHRMKGKHGFPPPPHRMKGERGFPPPPPHMRGGHGFPPPPHRMGKGRGGKRGERRAAMMRKFDKDGDGEFSAGERAAMRAAMKGHRRHGKRIRGCDGKCDCRRVRGE